MVNLQFDRIWSKTSVDTDYIQSEAELTDFFVRPFSRQMSVISAFFDLSNSQFRKKVSTTFGQMSVILSRKYFRYFGY